MKVYAPHRGSVTATTGVILCASCGMYLMLISFAAVYLYSFTGDLKRELAEAKIALLDAKEHRDEVAFKPLRGHDAGRALERDQAHKDDDFDILREMDQHMNRDRLRKIASQHKQNYAHNRPFPSQVFDDIFPRRILLKIAQEHPESSLEDGCLPGETNEGCKSGTVEGQKNKSKIDNDKNMGIFTKIFMGYLKSSAFVNFLEVLSGIEGIMPDPHYFGSGLHFTATGGKLDIHADFNALIHHKLERRVNLLLFLNDDWEPEYGGHLELWSRDMTRCSAKIAPVRILG
jgi:Rps23 Pro-64 3,4-dihydroxylase Tpa1-like proline 4-hydroxylase